MAKKRLGPLQLTSWSGGLAPKAEPAYSMRTQSPASLNPQALPHEPDQDSQQGSPRLIARSRSPSPSPSGHPIRRPEMTSTPARGPSVARLAHSIATLEFENPTSQ